MQDEPIIFLMQFSKEILNEYTTFQMFATFFFKEINTFIQNRDKLDWQWQ